MERAAPAASAFLHSSRTPSALRARKNAAAAPRPPSLVGLHAVAAPFPRPCAVTSLAAGHRAASASPPRASAAPAPRDPPHVASLLAPSPGVAAPILLQMHTTPTAVQLNYRPRRIAFLVDAAHERLQEVLDAILDFNISSWGGRHNPILPIRSGSLSPAYLPVLDAADPDIICAFGDLQQDLVTLLTHRYRPLDILSHGTYALDRVSVSLWGDQASVQQLLNSLASSPPAVFRHIDPALVHVTLVDEQKLSQFFRWNFGYSHLNHFAIRDAGVKALPVTVDSDASLVTQINSAANTVSLNIAICGDAPLAMQIGHPWLPVFTLFVGDDIETRTAYWNDALCVGRTSAFSIQRTLWLTTANLNDTELMSALMRLPAFMSGSSGYNSVLRLVSYDKTEDQLAEIGNTVRLRTHLAASLQTISHLSSPPSYPQPQPASRPLRHDVPQIEHAHSRTLHLPLHVPRPVTVDRDERLMVNLRVEEPDQELYYSNVSAWWRMPKHEGLNAAFGRLSCRVGANQELAVEVHADHRHLDVELPSIARLFQALLSPERQRRSSHDLRPQLQGQYRLRLSDKGRYASGILALAPSLQDTLRLFENPFCRRVLTRLAQSPIPQLATQQLQATIRRQLTNPATLDDTAWLADQITRVALATPSVTPMTYAEFQAEHASYLASLDDEHMRRYAQQIDIEYEFADLVRRRIILQGARIPCPMCGGRFWYGMHQINVSLTCQGCLSSFSFPAEATWSYHLNELLRRGINEFGLLPIFRTIGRIFDESTDDFFFLPGVQLVHCVNNELHPEFETDIVWIKDGEFGIAEVKTNARRFRPADRERLSRLCSIAFPDLIVLAAPDGNDIDLERFASDLRNDGLHARVEVILPSDFQTTRWPYA